MKVKEYGSGDKEIAVIGGTHGDEPMTAEAVYEVASEMEDRSDIDNSVKLIVANERALSQDVRYTEADLNRSFPGDKDSEIYEISLAGKIMDLLENSDAVLSIHSSMSAPPAFAITTYIKNPVNQKTIRALPVDYAIDNSLLRKGTMDSNLRNAVTLEAGHPKRENTRESAYTAVMEYLKAHGVLDEDPTYNQTNLVQVYKEMHKSSGSPKVHFNNFDTVQQGKVIAEDDSIQHISDSDGTVPVLLSKNGYEDIFGLLGRQSGVLTQDGIKNDNTSNSE